MQCSHFIGFGLDYWLSVERRIVGILSIHAMWSSEEREKLMGPACLA